MANTAKGEQGNHLTGSEDSQPFNIIELVENILKYLILRPETVLSIAKVSRRLNEIVHSKSFWTRMGFTDRLSKTAFIEPTALIKLLIGLRRDYIDKKYTRQKAYLKNKSKAIEAIPPALGFSDDELKLLKPSMEHFLAQRTFTPEAYIAVARIMIMSYFGQYGGIEDLLELTFIREDQIKCQEETYESRSEGTIFYAKFPKIYDFDFNGYHVLLDVEKPGDYAESIFSIRKKFLSNDRAIVFLINFTVPAVYFILINEQMNIIQSCGNLLLTALDPHGCPSKPLDGPSTWEEIIYKLSVYLSTVVFELETVDENLAELELSLIGAPSSLRGSQLLRTKNTPQYHWENIPLYINTPWTMGNERERDEDDNHLHEPIKKAKLSKKDKKDKLSKNEASVESAGTQLFDIAEIVENILQYLILKPETVLSIAKVSRRHNKIVHSKSFWTRMGFTDRLSKTASLELPVLVNLLIGLRRDHVDKKYDKQMAILAKNATLLPPIGLTIDLSEADLDVLRPHMQHFLTQRLGGLTSEAYVMIQTILRLSGFEYYTSVKEMQDMISLTEDQVQTKEDTVEYDDEGRKKIQRYPDYEFEGYYPLLAVKDSRDYEPYLDIMKKFISEDKSVIFFINHRKDTIYFISINTKSNMIECCGDLLLSALDPHNWTEDLYFNSVDEDVLYNISSFLSTFIFKLESVDEKLARQELACMHASSFVGSPIRVTRDEPQYYWENIPLYRK